jgi:hypothetical protein
MAKNSAGNSLMRDTPQRYRADGDTGDLQKDHFVLGSSPRFLLALIADQFRNCQQLFR